MDEAKLKSMLHALAAMTDIKVSQARRYIRKSALLDEEIHLQKELALVRDHFSMLATADATLLQYPELGRTLRLEIQDVLQHIIGLLSRMLKREHLPWRYKRRDISNAIREIARLLVDDSLHANRTFPTQSLIPVMPLLTPKQRRQLKRQRLC